VKNQELKDVGGPNKCAMQWKKSLKPINEKGSLNKQTNNHAPTPSFTKISSAPNVNQKANQK
jgi:hypothetical protein